MNSAELEHVMDTYGEHLLKMVYFYLRDRELAKDIVQEVFISFYEKTNYQEQGKLRAYLTKLTVNRCKDHLRSWSFRHLKFNKEWAETIHTEHDRLILQEEKSAIASAILALPIKYREIILFYYYEELTMREVAAFLDLSENTVKTRMTKARILLKDKLSADYWEVLSIE
ncbi:MULTISPECIES: sigma-70 family RNA polymerase sigma factor [unclassified Sporosarcina]|uniref:sigma-70 family RNA polymerase sigma factor n=1 Tax=unclassified Sporosarcina TaxID=2647733 RepID=UPI000C164139|nr:MULTISPECIES: sigma-70 family RNA polymerase sigma factor [unclassified Sporosarcina]PID05547.1 RNA polymerase [Sporosarcina sp. P30]PID08741.1 RNA polymerase [Sporosarcina sp. P31]PID11913.1 RNA polymerase [Sporosarcina sp. P32b]